MYLDLISTFYPTIRPFYADKNHVDIVLMAILKPDYFC